MGKKKRKRKMERLERALKRKESHDKVVGYLCEVIKKIMDGEAIVTGLEVENPEVDMSLLWESAIKQHLATGETIINITLVDVSNRPLESSRSRRPEPAGLPKPDSLFR